jgi:hypothetical protein
MGRGWKARAFFSILSRLRVVVSKIRFVPPHYTEAAVEHLSHCTRHVVSVLTMVPVSRLVQPYMLRISTEHGSHIYISFSRYNLWMIIDGHSAKHRKFIVYNTEYTLTHRSYITTC